MSNNVEQTRKRKPLSFWIAIVLGIMFFASVALNLFLIIALLVGKAGSERTYTYDEKFVAGDIRASEKILLIPVEGVIMSDGGVSSLFGSKSDLVKSVLDALKRAKNDIEIKVIILKVNSPGGGITDCDRIHRAILRFKEARPEVPIVVSMGNVAASGGYYISAPADKILALPTTITGSIGVIAHYINVEGLFQKIGLKENVLKAGKRKDIGSSTRPMTPDERRDLQKIIDRMHKRFIDIVEKGRVNLNLDQVKKLADGMIYAGEEALANGLVDQLGDFEDAIQVAKDLAHITRAKVIQYKKRMGFFELLVSAHQRYSPAQVDLVTTLKQMLLEENTPRILYMWQAE